MADDFCKSYGGKTRELDKKKYSLLYSNVLELYMGVCEKNVAIVG